MNDYGFDYNVKGIRAHRRGGSLDMVCSHGLAFCNFDAVPSCLISGRFYDSIFGPKDYLC